MSNPVLIRSLEANYYTDPEIFKTEQRGLASAMTKAIKVSSKAPVAKMDVKNCGVPV